VAFKGCLPVLEVLGMRAEATSNAVVTGVKAKEVCLG